MNPDPSELTIERVVQIAEEAPSVRVEYNDGETGWAAAISANLLVVLNVPVTTHRFGALDVATRAPSRIEGWSRVGSIIWRAYECSTSVKYGLGARSNFALMRRACERYGMRIEGIVEDEAIVNHQTHQLVSSVFRKEGLDVSRMVFSFAKIG